MPHPHQAKSVRRTIDLEFISLKELASRWQVSRPTVRRALSNAGIQPFFIGDKRNSTLRYAVSEVEQFMKKSKPDLKARAQATEPPSGQIND